eukprot:6085014-Prymnesium_polylepis.1
MTWEPRPNAGAKHSAAARVPAGRQRQADVPRGTVGEGKRIRECGVSSGMRKVCVGYFCATLCARACVRASVCVCGVRVPVSVSA